MPPLPDIPLFGKVPQYLYKKKWNIRPVSLVPSQCAPSPHGGLVAQEGGSHVMRTGFFTGPQRIEAPTSSLIHSYNREKMWCMNSLTE